MNPGEALEAVCAVLRPMGPLLVAYSGGADSALVVAIAHEVLHMDVVASIAVSPMLASRHLEDARRVARARGWRLEEGDSGAWADPLVRSNGPERCTRCKRLLFGRLSTLALAEGRTVADGTTASDEPGERPGMQVATELGVRSPLREAGISKDQVRAVAKLLDLPTWRKPPDSCLATRVPPGVELTEQVLRQIEEAEEALRRLGFDHVRVRHHHEVARIEVPPHRLNALLTRRHQVLEALRGCGYRFVCLDLAGYRSGALTPRGSR